MKGCLKRATRPPSWSTATHGGLVVGELDDLARHRRHLLRLLDVALEEDDAAERELARERAQLDRESGAGETGHQQLADLAAEGSW